jgi:hypothetical protein
MTRTLLIALLAVQASPATQPPVESVMLSFLEISKWSQTAG